MRFARDADRAWIRTCWARSYEDSIFARACGDSYWAVQNRVISRILARSSVHTRVACDADGRLVGFAVFEFPSRPGEGRGVHYVFTRVELRRRGIARGILRHLDIAWVSHPWGTYPWRPENAW